MAVPYDLYPVYKGNILQYLLLFYDSGWTFGKGQISMRVSDRIIPPFNFSQERVLGNCMLTSSGYTPCGASSSGLGVVQPPCTPQWISLGYYDSYCNPLAVLGYINATTKVCTYEYQGVTYKQPINFNSEGILPAKVSLTNTSWAFDIQDLKVEKINVSIVRLSWGNYIGGYINSYRVIKGSFGESFKKTGKYCPYYENVIYDHYRVKQKLTTNSIILNVPEDNAYFLVTPVCNEILMPDKQGNDFWCYQQVGNTYPYPVEPFIYNYISEGSMGYSSSEERLGPVCQYDENNQQQIYCGKYWPQPGDQWS